MSREKKSSNYQGLDFKNSSTLSHMHVFCLNHNLFSLENNFSRKVIPPNLIFFPEQIPRPNSLFIREFGDVKVKLGTSL